MPVAILWSHRDFRLLAFGQGLSWFGNAFATIALAVALLKGGHSATSLGVVMAAFTVGQLVFVVIGGVFADRLPPTHVMVASDIVRGLIAVGLAAMFATGAWTTPTLAGLFLILCVASAFFSPAMMSLKQKIVPAEERRASNTALSILQTGATIAGPAVGGVTVAAFGAPTGFALNAVSFLVSALCAAAIRVRPTVRAKSASLIADLKQGFEAITARPWLRAEILAAFTYHLGNGVVMVLLQVIAIGKLGGALALGTIETAAGIGGLVGGLVSARIHPGRPLLVGGLVLAVTPLGLIPLVAPLPLPVVAAGYGIGMCALVVFGVLYETTMQHHVPEEVYARVVSWDILGSFSVIPVGTALAGYLAQELGTSTALSMAIVLMLVATLAPLTIREVRLLTHTPTAAPSPVR